jgi:GntR family transcriptional regulator
MTGVDAYGVVYYSTDTPDMLTINPRSPLPLWRQIEDGVRNLVAVGALPAGAPVPSVRDLARELTVNPATIAKAYQHLSEAGVLEVRRGEGTFVSVGAPLLPLAERRRRLAEAARAYAAVARTLRVDLATALELVGQAAGEMEQGASDVDRDGDRRAAP